MKMKTQQALRRSALVLAVVAALVGPQLALADDAHEKALEARVAELERIVNQLAAQQKTQQAAAPAPRTAQDTSGITKKHAEANPSPYVLAAEAPSQKPIQDTTITPNSNPNTTFHFGGFIKADFLESRTSGGQLLDGATSRDLYLPSQIPVGATHGSHTDFDAHAKFSRINFGVDSITDAGDRVGAFVEYDFFGTALGTQVATNTYGATLRHAFVYWNNWLAGQTWSNFMDTSALPEAVDFIGPTDGVIFVRQNQLRYTDGGFSASLENHDTVLVPYKGGAGINTDRGAMPDLTARYNWKGSWGTFGVAGLLRDLTIDTPVVGTVPAHNNNKIAGALTAGGKFILGSSDDLRYQLTGGSSIGRYIGLGVASDGELDANGNIDGISGVAGYVAWRHVFNKEWRTNVMYAANHFDNDVALTGGAVTKSTESIRANIFYSPIAKLDLGAELMCGRRKLESGLDGDLNRLQFSVKYSF